MKLITLVCIFAPLVVVGVLPSHCATGSTQDKTPPAITAVAVAPDGTMVLTGSQAGVSIRGVKSKDPPSALAVKLDHVLAFAFAPGGKTLAIAGGHPAEAGLVELWSWPEKKRLGLLEGHTDLVHDVAWLDGGKVLATASADRTVRLWDFADKKTLCTLSGHSGPVLCLAALPDSKTLCSGSADQTIRVWSVGDGKLVRSLDNHLGAVHALAIRPKQGSDAPVTLASAGGDATVRIWQPGIGRLVRIVRQPAPIFCIHWNRDGSLLACAGKDGNLRTMDGDSDKQLGQRMLSKGWILSMAYAAGADELFLGTTKGELHTAAFPLAAPKPVSMP